VAALIEVWTYMQHRRREREREGLEAIVYETIAERFPQALRRSQDRWARKEFAGAR
jgi:hypothetical protein